MQCDQRFQIHDWATVYQLLDAKWRKKHLTPAENKAVRPR
jgi:hypothetical protein